MWPLELTETPETSPRYILAGKRSGLGTESKAMEGTACCARAGGPINSINPISQCFIYSSRELVRFFVDADASHRGRRRPSPARTFPVITAARPVHDAPQAIICYCIPGNGPRERMHMRFEANLRPASVLFALAALLAVLSAEPA